MESFAEYEQRNRIRPWDVPFFKSPDFPSSIQQSAPLASQPSVYDYDSSTPPPRPPPPKKCSTTGSLRSTDQPETRTKTRSLETSSSSIFSTKTSSEKVSSLLCKKQSNATSLRRHSFRQQRSEDGADGNLVIYAGQEARTSQLGTDQLMQCAADNESSPNAKQKVVLDLLNTERTYLFDLNTWETSIQESAQLSVEDKKALTNGYAALKQLSQTLISTILAQKDLPADDQHFGNAFMELKDRFFAAYAYHFRYVEQISVIVENEEDDALQKALQRCLLVMRQNGSNVFDVPTAVSRPIQRCLKYPLYVGELLKNTPIHHPDHPKLMESLRQFGSLASRMNECKRRKELIRKYRSQEQLSLADRLSRINMHSLVKKSNRLKYRINRSIGLNTARYTEFDYLVQLLEEAERRLCKFLYCAQLYKKHIEQSVKRHEDSYKVFCHAQDENVVKAFAVMFRRLDELCRRYLQTFDQEVITEGKKLVRSDLAKLVHKRFDKLADYETAKTTHKNSEEVETRRAEFEALNNQIKAQLPRVIGTINTRVLELVQRVNALDADFLCQMDEWFTDERPEKVRDGFSAALPFRAHLSASHRYTLAELNKIATHLSSGPSSLQKTKSLRISFRGAKSNPRLNDGETKQKTQKRRAQTTKERDALIKICHAQKQTQQLRLVQCDWESATMVLKSGDVVVVKAHRQDGFSLCDNAVTIGLVPVPLLCPFDNGFTSPLSLESPANERVHPKTIGSTEQNRQNFSEMPFLLLDFITPDQANINCKKADQTKPMPDKIASNSQSEKKDGREFDVNLIDLEDNLIDLDSPPKINVQPRELQPISSGFSEQIGSFLLEEEGVGRMSSASSPPIPDRPLSASDRHPTLPSPVLTSSSTSTDFTAFSANIHPIRIAPPPPVGNRRHDTIPQQRTMPGPIESAYNPPKNSCDNNSSPFPSPSFAVCVFDFAPSHNINEHLEDHQLTIMEGEMVEIIRRQDDAGNNEWWLVRKMGQDHHGVNSQQGYVPANYLSCLKKPMNTCV